MYLHLLTESTRIHRVVSSSIICPSSSQQSSRHSHSHCGPSRHTALIGLAQYSARPPALRTATEPIRVLRCYPRAYPYHGPFHPQSHISNHHPYTPALGSIPD